MWPSKTNVFDQTLHAVSKIKKFSYSSSSNNSKGNSYISFFLTSEEVTFSLYNLVVWFVTVCLEPVYQGSL